MVLLQPDGDLHRGRVELELVACSRDDPPRVGALKHVGEGGAVQKLIKLGELLWADGSDTVTIRRGAVTYFEEID
jgi:hypothetical protein